MSITLAIPDNIGLTEKETKRFLAAKLYESGKLSLGQAAKLAGLSIVAFSEILADFNVALFNYDPSEIKKDVENF